jgi:uncharacterized membrane protein YdjX (TVP38/TMEM64 family)
LEAPSKPDSQNKAAHEIAKTVGNYLAGGKMEARGEYLFFLAVSWLFLLGVMAALVYLMFAPWWARVFQFLTDKEKIAGLVQSMGSWGPVVFILVQAVQTLLLFVPAPVEAVGGFLFGLPLGILYSTLGLGLGSLAAFSLGRWLERHWLSEVVPPQKLKRFRMLMRRQGTLTVFIIFLIPGAPKDLFCYLLGLTRMSWHYFLMLVTLARLPGTIMSALQGSQAQKGNYYLTVGLWIFSLGIAILLYYYRDNLYQWTKRWQPEEE